MKRLLGLGMVLLIVLWSWAPAEAWAKKGGEPKGTQPPGFSHGEKKGWGGAEHPPGWGKGKKKGWGGQPHPPGFHEKGKKKK